MSGNQMGSLKAKLGLKGKTKPGEMISKMNEMQNMKCKSCDMNYKMHSGKDHKFSTIKKVMAKKTSGIKTTGKSFGKPNRLGGGGRFAQVEHSVAGKKGVYNPGGLAAYIGRRSLGKAKFQHLATAGKKKGKKNGKK